MSDFKQQSKENAQKLYEIILSGGEFSMWDASEYLSLPSYEKQKKWFQADSIHGGDHYTMCSVQDDRTDFYAGLDEEPELWCFFPDLKKLFQHAYLKPMSREQVSIVWKMRKAFSYLRDWSKAG